MSTIINMVVVNILCLDQEAENILKHFKKS
jgi:hypothetical protein